MEIELQEHSFETLTQHSTCYASSTQFVFLINNESKWLLKFIMLLPDVRFSVSEKVKNTWSYMFTPLHVFSVLHNLIWAQGLCNFASSGIIMKWVVYLLVNYMLECLFISLIVSTNSEYVMIFSDIFQVDQKQKISRNYGFRLNWNLFSVWPIQTISIVMQFSYNIWIMYHL